MSGSGSLMRNSLLILPMAMCCLFVIERYNTHAHALRHRQLEARRLLHSVCINHHGELVRYSADFLDCTLIHKEATDTKLRQRATLLALQDAWSTSEREAVRLFEFGIQVLSSQLYVLCIPLLCICCFAGAWWGHHRTNVYGKCELPLSGPPPISRLDYYSDQFPS